MELHWAGLSVIAVLMYGLATVCMSVHSTFQRKNALKNDMRSIVQLSQGNRRVVKRSSFKAAVYEHPVILPLLPYYSRQGALRAMSKNLDIYEAQVVLARSKGADIIVFPEDGVYGMVFTRRKIEPFLEYIPDPKTEQWNPCLDPERYPDTEIQHRLSCMARDNTLYLAANIGDRKSCNKTTDPNCPDDGRYQYNTNVVYSPEGLLVARYHKRNLFAEEQFNTPPTAEEIYFDTPFGRFGTFTCFDVLFRFPAVDLIEKHGIDTVIFPTAWMDAIPLLAAVEYHSAFAVMMNVNFLSANIHLPLFRFGGSGIYTPTGQVAFYRNENTSQGKLLVASIPTTSTPTHRHPQQLRFTSSLNQRQVHSYQQNSGNCSFNSHCNHFKSVVFHDLYDFVWLRALSGSLKVCQGQVCCRLDYRLSTRLNTSGNEYFALGVFDGMHTNDYVYYLQVCTLLKCGNQKGSSCGDVVKQSRTYFSSVSIRGEFQTPYIAPEILVNDNGGNLALPSGGWSFEHDNKALNIHNLTEPVVSVNLFGRWYDNDPS